MYGNPPLRRASEHNSARDGKEPWFRSKEILAKEGGNQAALSPSAGDSLGFGTLPDPTCWLWSAQDVRLTYVLTLWCVPAAIDHP
jgi:hypothetical protein